LLFANRWPKKWIALYFTCLTKFFKDHSCLSYKIGFNENPKSSLIAAHL
jgi:hypothetical protein